MSDSMYVRDVWATQYRPKQLRDASDSGIKIWQIALRMFDRFLGRPATLEDLNDETVDAFMVWRREGGKKNVATVNRDLVCLLALWRWCHRHGMLSHWPTVRKYPEPVRTPVAWTEDEFNRILLAASRLETTHRDGMPAKAWWVALLLLALDTGERIGALLGVEWKDVDLEQRFVTFRAETRKGRRRDHQLEFSAETAAALERLKCNGGNDVFPWPYCKASVWRTYGQILVDAGLPADSKRKFHCIRRTTASYVEANGGDATATLGHASRVTTERYIDKRIARPRAAHTMLFRPEIPTTATRPPVTDEDERRAAGESLEAYLRVVHARRREMTPGGVNHYTVLIRQLERHAGRTLRLSDLTFDLLDRWQRTISGRDNTKRTYMTAALALWNSAYTWGFLATAPPALADFGDRTTPEVTDEELAAADTSLAAFLEQVYVPRRGVDSATAHKYGLSIKRLERHAFRSLTVHDLSDELLAAAAEALGKTLPSTTIATLRKEIRSLWSAAHEWGFIDTPPSRTEATQ